ncbi:hypothetical protein CBF49_08935, partial [Lactobacillus taiwanensis]
MQAFGSTGELHQKLFNLSAEEESGTPCVEVDCVESSKNTSGEGAHLVPTVGWGPKDELANGHRSPSSPSRTRSIL